jgi:type I restriction enzyme, R subunit
VKQGTSDRDILSSLAGRLARMDRRIGAEQRHALAELAGNFTLGQIAHAIVNALDPDRQLDEARRLGGLPEAATPTEAQLAAAAKALIGQAVAPLRAGRALRDALASAQKSLEQAIDATSIDTLLDARAAPEIKQRISEKVVQGFEAFIAAHKDEITALQVLYSRPYRHRLTNADVKALVDQIQAPPRSWTPDMLWRAYDALHHDKVRGAGSQRLLTDVVSLVRFALHQDGELVPYADKVKERFAAWILQQENAGKKFTEEQRKWLEAIRDHVAGNVEIAMDDFEQVPFKKFGGMGKAYKVFGPEIEAMLAELNEVLAA